MKTLKYELSPVFANLYVSEPVSPGSCVYHFFKANRQIHTLKQLRENKKEVTE